MSDFIRPANPAFVVSTNNTRIVPNRKKATSKEVEAFKDSLREEKNVKKEKAKKEAK